MVSSFHLALLEVYSMTKLPFMRSTIPGDGMILDSFLERPSFLAEGVNPHQEERIPDQFRILTTDPSTFIVALAGVNT